MFRHQKLILILIVAVQLLSFNHAFSMTKSVVIPQKISIHRLFDSATDEPADESTPDKPTTSDSLESKMKSWEASEEEIKAATLGGMVPGRSDAFDIGLYVAFPLMVLSGLAFAFFPLIMGNIDTSSVGPPPTS
ncbi:unnamed protein product [Cylindrotheca closterium]|uniref:Transmembrane protein n=1 Tax=Cylindrotheca closterium TaxID=2856 RepID=A0AAD2JIC9_9STRA|nr:unnamed protein product [Cylindrotheca closterium]